MYAPLLHTSYENHKARMISIGAKPLTFVQYFAIASNAVELQIQEKNGTV